MPQRTDSKSGVFLLHLAAGSRSLSRSDCLMTTPMYFSHLLDTNHHSMPPHSPTKANILSANQFLELFEKKNRSAKCKDINIYIGVKVQRSNINCIFQLTCSQSNANSDHKQPAHQPTYHLSILACPSDLSVTVSSPTETR